MAEKLLKNLYLIEDVDRDKLGAGSFGSTYLAKDTRYLSFVKKVVVKHLQPPVRLFDTALNHYLKDVTTQIIRLQLNCTKQKIFNSKACGQNKNSNNHSTANKAPKA
jgi:hypothetical protein